MRLLILQVLLLIILSASVIFFQFDQIPKKLSFDEVEFARLALSLQNKGYTPYSTLATGHSTLYFYLILFSFGLFGVNNFALRFPSAFFGVLNTLVFFFICRIVFKKFFYSKKNALGKLRLVLPFILSCIFLSLRWYFNFARFSFEATFLLFLELISILFLFLWLEKRRSIYFVLSAVAAGLSFLSYYPGRIFFLLPLSSIFILSRKDRIKKSIKYGIIVLIVAFPLTGYILFHPDLRVKEQLFLTDKKLSIIQKINYFSTNIARSAYSFNLFGDLNGRHNYPGKPIMNPIAGTFFLFGILVSVLNIHIFYNRFFLAFFALSIIPTLFTYPAENPNVLRIFTSIVPAVYFIGNGLVYLFEAEERAKKTVFIVFAAIILMFALGAMYDVRTYFKYQKNVFKKAFEVNGRLPIILRLRLWEKTDFL